MPWWRINAKSKFAHKIYTHRYSSSLMKVRGFKFHGHVLLFHKLGLLDSFYTKEIVWLQTLCERVNNHKGLNWKIRDWHRNMKRMIIKEGEVKIRGKGERGFFSIFYKKKKKTYNDMLSKGIM